MTNIHVVTKNILFGQSLRLFLEGDMPDSEVGCCCYLEDIPNLKKAPAIVVFEMPMEFHGYGSFRDLTTLVPNIKILAMVGSPHLTTYKRLIDQGVKGCIPLGSSLAELTNAIREVSAGKICYPYEVLKQIMQSKQADVEKQAGGLTEREIEILRLLCEGLSNAEISEKLHLSSDTIKWHRGNISVKCGCKNILSLYKYALHHKLLQLTDVI